MSDEIDWSALSTEELKAIIEGADPTQAPPGAGSSTLARRNAAVEALVDRQVLDSSMGMSGMDLFRAGAGMVPGKLLEGIKDMALRATLSDDPTIRERQLSELNARRASQEDIDRMLLSNPAAMGGRLVGEGAVAASAPARIMTQVGLQGAMGATRPPSGPSATLPGELASRAFEGAMGGATQAAVQVPLMAAGKAIGAARGSYAPEGQHAMDLNAAAQRIGVNPTIRDLDPSSEIAGLEGQLFGRAKEVERQVAAFNSAAGATKPVPSATGRSTTDRLLEGEKLREAVVQGTQALEASGGKLWKELDDYISQNNVPPVIPQGTFTKIEDILQRFTPKDKKNTYLFDKNDIISRVAYFDDDAAAKLVAVGRAPQAAVKFGAPFQDLHKIQSAVGKALAKARMDAEAPNAGRKARDAATELSKLYGSIATDVDGWINTTVAKTGNQELAQLSSRAKDYWRDVVIPGTSSNMVDKAGRGTWRQSPKGYAEPQAFYTDLSKAMTQMDEIYPFLTKEQQDLMTTFFGMDDMKKALTSGTPHPPATGSGLISNLGGMLIGSPLQLAKGALGHTTMLSGPAGSNALKRLHFAKNAMENSALGRVSNAITQKPRWTIDQWANERLSRDK